MSFDILKVSWLFRCHKSSSFDTFPAGQHRGFVFMHATDHLFFTFIWQSPSDLSSWILVFIVRRWNILSGSPLGLCLFLLPSLIHVFRQLKHLELTLHVKKHFQNQRPTQNLLIKAVFTAASLNFLCGKRTHYLKCKRPLPSSCTVQSL